MSSRFRNDLDTEVASYRLGSEPDRGVGQEAVGVLNCDVDVLRTMIGGWERDFVGAGALIRPVALAMIPAYLANDRDVVLPQMLVQLEELQKFEAAALRAGGEFVELMLMDEREAAVARFYRRGEGCADAWHGLVRAIVGANGGDSALADYHDGLHALRALRPAAVVVNSVEGQIDETYRAVVEALGGGAGPPGRARP